MATQARPPPHCWFGIEEIWQGRDFRDRVVNTHWAPPRRLGSNVCHRNGSRTQWFHFSNWQTQQAPSRPHPAIAAPYQFHETWSFYYNEGSIWLYRANATQLQVGDGSGNPRRDGQPGGVVQTPDSSDDEEDNPDPRWDDWQPLEFDLQDITRACYAQANGYQRRLDCQQRESAALQELLPMGYHAESARRCAPEGYGGLNGEFHILLALIAFSVSPNRWTQAFSRSLQRGYSPHGLPNGRQAHNRRGVLVHVLCPTHPQVPRYPGRMTPLQMEVDNLSRFANGDYGTFAR